MNLALLCERIRSRVCAEHISIALLALQGFLLTNSAFDNSVTVDEANHLPAGISYWHKGEFWCYHHNPPLIKIAAAVPAVIMRIPVDYSHFYYTPGSRVPDFLLGGDFVARNAKRYEWIFGVSRLVIVAFTLWGGRLVYRWACELFGSRAGILAQILWCFCPSVNGHGSLVSVDMGATVVGFYATYQFYKYLQGPSVWRAMYSGACLGAAEASKYSLVVLPVIWIVILLCQIRVRRCSHTKYAGCWYARDAVAVCLLSLVVLNNAYLFEGSFSRLGDMPFLSQALTKAVDDQNERVNRFQGTILASLRMPFPRHYLLGLDDQLRDSESGRFENYLRGEIRRGHGWWYFYIYCIIVKTPLGTLALGLASCALFARTLSGGSNVRVNAMLLIPIVFVLTTASFMDGMIAHSRYLLPVTPYAMVFIGGSATYFSGATWKSVVLYGLTSLTVISTCSVHPYYLTYFNEASGGAAKGFEHLADSNLDWGQGLIALRRWIGVHGSHRPIQLAYFGGVSPELLGIEYTVPGYFSEVEGRRDVYALPSPGLHIISVNYVAGLSYPVRDGKGGRKVIPERAYAFYRELHPVGIIGNCFFVYEVSEHDLATIQRRVSG
ncbi:MAG: hypothetical protein JWP89_1265 [Schlesneria sp.]|nr:hypothetical protein [Schlesneria sp.]